MDSVEVKVGEGNVNINEVLQRLEHLNTTTSAILSHSEGSMQSLQSVSSSLSRMSSHSELSRFTDERAPLSYRSNGRRMTPLSRPSSSRASTAPSLGPSINTGYRGLSNPISLDPIPQFAPYEVPNTRRSDIVWIEQQPECVIHSWAGNLLA
jgi:hypothetical protein